ncbi:MAG TPA: hypothetical protein VF466_03945 [Candidatus Saccharimonadales bacterium]
MSAARVAQYLPLAQVQMVHTLHTGNRVNGAPLETARSCAVRYAGLGKLPLAASGLKVAGGLTFTTDPLEPLELDETKITAALAKLPHAHRDRLLNGGHKRGADAIAYIAAHVQMHDTAAALLPLRPEDPEPIAPSRIISLGAQSERAFYLARMACRDEGLPVPGQVETAQLFTRHVLPPYQFDSRGCSEPPMEEILAAPPFRQPLEWAPIPYEKVAAELSATRDLTYLDMCMNQGGHIYA